MKPLKILFLSSLLVSCATTKIYDDKWCADAGPRGAECFKMLSGEEETMDKFKWDSVRRGQICTGDEENPGIGYAHFKAAILDLCANSSKCDWEKVNAILGKFDKTIEAAK